jgi:hypothetical protein
VPVGAEDEDSTSSYHFPLIRDLRVSRMSVISGYTLKYV